jgi:hypothetical protein
MKSFKSSTKLEFLTRHQDADGFMPEQTLGEVVESTDDHPQRMKVRVYRPDGRAQKGSLHVLLRVTDSVWLERIGTRVKKGRAANLPHVHEVIGELTEEEFAKKHAALIATAMGSRTPAEPANDSWPRFWVRFSCGALLGLLGGFVLWVSMFDDVWTGWLFIPAFTMLLAVVCGWWDWDIRDGRRLHEQSRYVEPDGG